MYELKYPKGDRQAKEIENRLGELSLAFKIKHLSPASKEIVLVEGQKEIVGPSAIHAHLNELKAELHHWYYCNC